MLRHASLVVLMAVLVVPATAAAVTAPIVTIAGNGQGGPFSPGLQPATAVSLPTAADIDATPVTGGGVVFADPLDHRVLQVYDDGTIGVLAGTGSPGYNQNLDNDVPPDQAHLTSPEGVAFLDSPGAFGYLIADTGNRCIRSIQATFPPMKIFVDAGLCLYGAPPSTGEDGTRYSGTGSFGAPIAVAPWPAGDGYYVADYTKVRLVNGNAITTVVGPGDDQVYPPDDGSSATSAFIGSPLDVDVTDIATTYYVVAGDEFRSYWRVFKIVSGLIYTVAGGGSGPGIGDGGSPTSASLNKPTSLALLKDGGFLVYDGGNARIRRVTGGISPTIHTIAGTGTVGSSADGTPAGAASLRSNGHLTVRQDGLFFTQSDVSSPGLVRKIPSTAITSGPTGFTTSKSATFALASWDDDATYECKLDQEAFGPCHAYPDVTEGQHTFTAQATTNSDDAGMNGAVDTSGAARTWTVDATPPTDFSLVSPDDGATVGPKPSFTWQQASDAITSVVRYELWIDGAKAAETTACCAADAPASLADGSHTWQVKAIDRAGNVRASAMRSFTVAAPPVATLVVSPNPALVNRPVTFSGSQSSDSNGSIVHYEWDLDGDGAFETETGTTPQAVRSYDRPQTITVALRVTDNDHITATTAGRLTVTSPPPLGKQLGVSINDGAQYTNDPNVTVFAVWPSFASNMLVSNDGGFKLAQDFPVAEQTAWKLDSSGPERLPKTIYIRYLGGVQTSETYTDDIILDQTPPKVLNAAVAGTASAGAVHSAKAKLVVLRIKATDNASGVGAMQVTSNKRRPGRFLTYKRTVKVKPAKVLYVRVRDRARNLSRWRKVAKR